MTGRRDALVLVLLALLAVLAVVALVALGRTLTASVDHHPPHVERPAADAPQEQPTTTLHTEVTMTTTTLPTTTVPPVTIPPTTPPTVALEPGPTPLDNPDGFLACVRNRESGGDYTIHNLAGSGASGAYQFMPATWDALAAELGRTDLIGIDPAAASPADQDAMAAALYARQGAAPWGGGC